MAISTINSAGTSGVITQGTAQNSTSGTSIDFTGIPSWAKRVTIVLNGVSLSGSADLTIQVGSGSITTSGYTVTWGYVYTASSAGINSGSTSLVRAAALTSATTWSGTVIINSLSGNTWVGNSTLSSAVDKIATFSNGSVSLGGTLDRVRITTSNGTDTFDAGSINILYE